MNNLIIGLGCSFTQGEGCCAVGNPDRERARAYPQLIANELGWDCVNHAERGQGGRSQALRLLTTDVSNYDKVVVIYQQTGGERFDWNTIWQGEIHATTRYAGPHKWDGWYNQQRDFTEQLHNLLQIQTWCKANSAQLIVWSAYDPLTTRHQLCKYFSEHFNVYYKTMWRKFSKLVELDNWWCIDDDDDLILYDYFRENLGDEYKWYVDNNTKFKANGDPNDFHPSELGHRWIAEQLIKQIRYI